MKTPAHTSEALAQRPDRFVSRFHADIYAPPDRTIVRAHGEIDLATRAAFRAALSAGLDRAPLLLVVDLGGVSVLGACGLGVLFDAANRAARADIPIMVIGARPRIYRLFALTRLVERLDVRPAPVMGTLIPAAVGGPAGALTSWAQDGASS
ncbi:MULTISPECIES: STAS domain-containing protein [Pseudofrankia]|uniref:STAS domain-containing protein n=1 Tax=Pseudofrankia TaxID=2994363 RepID=UPI000234D623|nr:MULTISPECIES: STAS domain-containing protein [Pseudofrankia]